MQEMIDNFKASLFIKLAAGIFVIQTFFDYNTSVDYNNSEILYKGIIDNAYSFLLLYALGVILDKKLKK